MRVSTKARKKGATTAIATVTGTHKNSAPTTTRPKTTVQGLAIAICTSVIFAWRSSVGTIPRIRITTATIGMIATIEIGTGMIAIETEIKTIGGAATGIFMA